MKNINHPIYLLFKLKASHTELESHWVKNSNNNKFLYMWGKFMIA